MQKSVYLLALIMRKKDKKHTCLIEKNYTYNKMVMNRKASAYHQYTFAFFIVYKTYNLKLIF